MKAVILKYFAITLIIFLGVFIFMPFINSCSQNPRQSGNASLAVINAKIWTADSLHRFAEALAVQSDTIVAVGSNAEIQNLIDTDTRVVDAGKQMVVPGFIDAHLHFLEGGFRLSSVQLRDAKTPQEFISRISEFAQTVEPGTWVTGGDWDHELWGGELPTRNWIDADTPHTPVWASRLDGHMALANSLALKAAGISMDTPDVVGGTIVRDSTGSPTGILKDNAMSLVERIVPEPTDEMKDRALQAAMDNVIKQGVTSVHHMGTWDDLEVFRRAHQAKKLRTRISASVPISTWERLEVEIRRRGRGDKWLRIGGLKGYVDGSLGSHTAAFFEPYQDAPNDSGLLVNSPQQLYDWISKADKAGLAVLVHAIGDRAISTLLDIYERVDSENGARDRRFRIEHSQHIAPKDFRRYRAVDAIASMQPYHTIDDGRWAEKVIGSERIKTTYAFRSLLDAGVRLAFGSDWFVAPPTPIEGIYAAVTRRTLDDKNPDGWVPRQKITVEEALRAYTIDAAFASFEEGLKGSLQVGKLADFVMLNRDLLAVAPVEIRDVKVTMTVVGGEIVFQSL